MFGGVRMFYLLLWELESCELRSRQRIGTQARVLVIREERNMMQVHVLEVERR